MHERCVIAQREGGGRKGEEGEGEIHTRAHTHSLSLYLSISTSRPLDLSPPLANARSQPNETKRGHNPPAVTRVSWLARPAAKPATLLLPLHQPVPQLLGVIDALDAAAEPQRRETAERLPAVRLCAREHAKPTVVILASSNVLHDPFHNSAPLQCSEELQRADDAVRKAERIQDEPKRQRGGGYRDWC